MYLYNICGLTVQSDLYFPELETIEKQPDIVIHLGNLDTFSSSSDNTINSFVAENKIAKVFLNQGIEIVIEPAENIEECVLRNFILGPVLASLLRQRRLLVFHGSAVEINNSAVAFLGKSGWGKSTLASAFHKQGYNLITDDVMAVQMKMDCPMVLPSFPKTKLWKDAATAMEYNVEKLPRVHSNSEKYIHSLANRFAETPLLVKRIYILAEGHEHNIEPINGRGALVELIRHSHGVDLLEIPELTTFNFNQCLKLIKHVPICRLIRPRSLSQLTESIKLVEEDLDESICEISSQFNSKISQNYVGR